MAARESFDGLSPKQLRALVRERTAALVVAFDKLARAHGSLAERFGGDLPRGARRRTASAFDRLLVQRFGYRPSDNALEKMRAASRATLRKIARGEPVRADVVERLASRLQVPESRLRRAIARKPERGEANASPR